MHINDTIDIEITALTSEGQGLGRDNGMAVFVNAAIPGDKVSVQITRLAKKYAEARSIRLLAASSDRIEPSCKVAARCGGCNLQHMEYGAQSRWKQQSVIEAMIRIGGFDRDKIASITNEIRSAEFPFHYRNKVQMPVSGTRENPQIGFFENNSHTVVDSDECIVQHRIIDAVRGCIRELILSKGLEPYNEDTEEGLIRHVMVRVGYATGQVMVVPVLAREDLWFFDALRRLLEEAIHAEGMTLTALYANINPGKNFAVLGKDFELIHGCGYIDEVLNGITFRISPDAFFQVNTAMAEKMFQEVLRLADLRPGDTVFDLYCGTGSISLTLAKHCRNVIGVEVVEQAIQDANTNATVNGITNAAFFIGRTEEILPQLISNNIRADVVVLDPPRKGAEESVLKAIRSTKPSRIVYVSCNPATLARDCKILCENDLYKIAAVSPVDLFPWTSHVESVILMSRNDTKKV
ncbi:MAG: 23S rRNA (uracil(1939)-C(5))-methyltransferase RlmD [Saccharofermentanales bacterium]